MNANKRICFKENYGRHREYERESEFTLTNISFFAVAKEKRSLRPFASSFITVRLCQLALDPLSNGVKEYNLSKFIQQFKTYILSLYIIPNEKKNVFRNDLEIVTDLNELNMT